MSSEDEMNNWEQPPDAHPPPVARPKRTKTKPSSPGPTDIPQGKTPSKREPVVHLESGDDVPSTEAPARPPPKSKPRSKTATVANNQKGQGKASSSKPMKKVLASDDAMQVDEEAGQVTVQTTSNSTTVGTSKAYSPSDHDVKSRKELDRWKQKAKDLEAQRDALSKQLEELFQIRRTEPEQILEQLQIQYDERVKTQDALIKELTSQLARVEPLSRTGQVVALHFLTREAADEEKRAAEQEISRLQEVIKAREGMIDKKIERIAELEQSVQDAIRERDAEIERSKELLARAAPKGTPNLRPQSKRPFGLDDPKMTEVIKFYEDMSNLLVTNVKFEHAPDSEEPDIVFHCIYTYYDMSRRDDDIEGERINEKSIVFTMRIFNGFGGPNGEPASEDDFIHRRIKYTPLHLDKELETFVKGLEFIGETFTFPCAQQGLFLNSLRDKIRDATKDTSELGSDEEGVEIGDHDS